MLCAMIDTISPLSTHLDDHGLQSFQPIITINVELLAIGSMENDHGSLSVAESLQHLAGFSCHYPAAPAAIQYPTALLLYQSLCLGDNKGTSANNSLQEWCLLSLGSVL